MRELHGAALRAHRTARGGALVVGGAAGVRASAAGFTLGYCHRLTFPSEQTAHTAPIHSNTRKRILTRNPPPWKGKLQSARPLPSAPQRNPAARNGRPGPMHPLACRGAVGYNQQANGRFALLWLELCLRVDPQGQPPIPRAAVPFLTANPPASSGCQAQGQKRQRENSGRQEQLRQIRHGNPPLPLQGLGGHRPRSRVR